MPNMIASIEIDKLTTISSISPRSSEGRKYQDKIVKRYAEAPSAEFPHWL